MLGTPQDFPGLDPMLTSLANANNLHSLLWNGLTRYDENMAVQPELAEKWEIVDSKTIVFSLRKGVKFHNGREVTADDVKFSIERIVNPETNSPWRANVEKVRSVDVVDKYTAKVNLSKPNVIQPAALTYIKIMPKEAVAEAVKNPIGTGPYRLAEFVPGSRIVLKRFDGYWEQPKPYPEQFIVQIVKDATALFNAFKTGQFDVLWQLPNSKVKEVAESKALQLVKQKFTSANQALFVDCSQPPFDNKLARLGLVYATDKDTIFDLAWYKGGTLSKNNNLVPPNHWAFNPNLKEYPYDLKKAAELFRAAGIKEGYKLRYNAISGSVQEWIVQGEILERTFQQVGIKLEIRPVDLAEWNKTRGAAGEHWANVLTPNGNRRDWDPADLLTGYSCNERIQNAFYCNPAVDALLDQGVAEVDQEKRKQIYWKLQEILWEEVPWVNTYFREFYHASQQHVKGIFHDSIGNLHFEGSWTEKQ